MFIVAIGVTPSSLYISVPSLSAIKITFSTEHGDIDVIQKVGFFVRRIVNNIKIGDKVKQCEPYGLILFGSRVDIILPKHIKSNLKTNQKVIAGVTSLI